MLREVIADLGVRQIALARESGVPRWAIYSALNGDTTFTKEQEAKLIRALTARAERAEKAIAVLKQVVNA